MKKIGTGMEALIEGGSYWPVNWKLVQYFGRLDEAVMLGYLCCIQGLFGDENGVFYRTIRGMAVDTMMDVRRQRRAVNNLKKLGLIKSENLGMPRRRYFELNADAIRKFNEQ